MRTNTRRGRMRLTNIAARASLRLVFQRVIELAYRHFWNHRHRSKGEFLWRITLESLLVAIGVAYVLALLGDPGRTDLQHLSDWEFALECCVFAPVLETLIFQAFPVMVVGLAGGGFGKCVIAGWVPFALAHFSVGIGTGVCAGIVGGFYLGFAYAHWRRESLRAALGMTMAHHALSNAAVVIARILL